MGKEDIWWSVLVTTATNIGAMFSALSAGYFMNKFGKWSLIMSMNVLVILGSALTLIDNMYVICAGRILLGLAMGGFSVYCPNFINDTVPTELKGPLGAFINSGVAIGILIPALLGLAIPDNPIEEVNSFFV
jgi:MFS family permease